MHIRPTGAAYPLPMDLGQLRARLAGSRFASIDWTAETGSTNADLLDAASAGAPDGTVLVAGHQLAGRGRLDRRWEAPPGAALLVSILLRPGLAASDRHLLTTALGLAALEAVRATTGLVVALKWPNDLIVGAGDSRKLGGILAEARDDAVVLGIGINVAFGGDFPPELESIAASLDELTGHVVPPEELLVELLVAFGEHLDALEADRAAAGPELMAAYRARCTTIGAEVRVERPDPADPMTGTAVDITEAGELVVLAGEEHHRVAVGDVVHVRRGTG